MKLQKTTLLFCLFLIFVSCKKDENPTEVDRLDKVKNEVKTLTDEWYLWYDQTPDLDPKNYTTPDDYMRALRVTPPDIWSSVQLEQSYDAFYQEGEYLGLGLSLSRTTENEIFIRFVYQDSPAGRAGLKRSDKILEINGVAVENITNFNLALGDNEIGVQTVFKYLDLETNQIQTKTISKEIVKINTILSNKILTTNTGKKIGYVVFQSFILPAEAELDAVFDNFKANSVDELVLDLRYNGGGRVSVANYLASKIAPSSVNNQIFLTLDHNDKKQSENQTYNFEMASNNLNLSRVFVIASRSTASASEAIINGLKPYMPVIQMGTTSYGKPVGSYGFKYEGYVISPISVRVTNADGNGDYYEGIPADFKVDDDLTHEFGKEEHIVASTVELIELGFFGGGRFDTVTPSEKLLLDYTTIQGEIGAF